MKSKKTLLASCLIIALCISLICGATFAIFTDGASTSIVVSGGKVEIDAEVTSLTLYSLDEETQQIVEQQDNFATGGTATLIGNSLALERIVPGDGVELVLSVKNNSTVSIKYAVIVAINNMIVDGTHKLSDVLVVTVDGEPVTDGASEWQTLAAEEQFPSDTMTVAVSLPVATGNDYQGLSSAIEIVIYAVQSNADTSGLKFAYSQEQFEEALANAEEGDTIQLATGVEYELDANTTIPAGVTISGSEDTVLTVGNDDSTSGTGLAITNDNVTISNVTIVGKNISQEENANYAGVIRVSGNNVTLDNVTVKSTTSTSPIVIGSTKGGADNVITIKNCHVEAYDRTIFIVDGTTGTINIEGCYLAGLYPININTTSTIEALNVSDCTLKGWTSFGGSTKIATFNNTVFAQNTSNRYNVLASYTTTVLNGCTFGSGFKFYVQKDGISITVRDAKLETGHSSFAELVAAYNNDAQYEIDED